MITAAVILVSLVSLVFIVRSTRLANAQANAVQNDINNLGRQEQALRQQAETIKNSLTSEQLQTLDAAHALVDRKHFSWSLLFADLESALPGAVRVKSIAVRRVVTRGDETLAELDMTVVAKTPAIVTEMIAEMDRAGVFHSELRAQNLQRGRGESGADYRARASLGPGTCFNPNSRDCENGCRTASCTGSSSRQKGFTTGGRPRSCSRENGYRTASRSVPSTRSKNPDAGAAGRLGAARSQARTDSEYERGRAEPRDRRGRSPGHCAGRPHGGLARDRTPGDFAGRTGKGEMRAAGGGN